jgi:hypothetical protein
MAPEPLQPGRRSSFPSNTTILLVAAHTCSLFFHDLFELKRLNGKRITQTPKQFALAWICCRRAQQGQLLRSIAKSVPLPVRSLMAQCPGLMVVGLRPNAPKRSPCPHRAKTGARPLRIQDLFPKSKQLSPLLLQPITNDY